MSTSKNNSTRSKSEYDDLVYEISERSKLTIFLALMVILFAVVWIFTVFPFIYYYRELSLVDLAIQFFSVNIIVIV